MRQLRAWSLRLAGMFNRRQRDCELSAEMESHLQMHMEENIRAGMSPLEARRLALIQLGGAGFRCSKPWCRTSATRCGCCAGVPDLPPSQSRRLRLALARIP